MRHTSISNGRLDLRRFLGVVCMALSLLIFFSVIVSFVNSCRSSAPATTPAQPVVTCTTPHHQAGDSSVSMTSAGLKRTFLVHLAPSYGKQPQPLIIGYHGYSWTVQLMERNTRLNTEADSAGFVVVYPQGVDSPPSWNAGVGAYGPTGDADDIQFTRDLLSYMEKNYCVDAHRVYITGFSLGGGMAYRVACTLSDQIAAVATVSGAYYPFPGGCQPARSLPVLEIHGEADQFAPYTGNPAARMAAVHDYLNVWLNRDRCNGTSNVFFQQGDVTGIEWTHCTPGTQVVHYRISDGGHSWFGSPRVLNTDAVIWQFFSKFSL